MYLSIDAYNLFHASLVIGIFNRSVFKDRNEIYPMEKFSNSIIVLTNNQRFYSPLRPATLSKRVQRQLKKGILEIIKVSD